MFVLSRSDAYPFVVPLEDSNMDETTPMNPNPFSRKANNRKEPFVAKQSSVGTSFASFAQLYALYMTVAIVAALTLPHGHGVWLDERGIGSGAINALVLLAACFSVLSGVACLDILRILIQFAQYDYGANYDGEYEYDFEYDYGRQRQRPRQRSGIMAFVLASQFVKHAFFAWAIWCSFVLAVMTILALGRQSVVLGWVASSNTFVAGLFALFIIAALVVLVAAFVYTIVACINGCNETSITTPRKVDVRNLLEPVVLRNP